MSKKGATVPDSSVTRRGVPFLSAESMRAAALVRAAQQRSQAGGVAPPPAAPPTASTASAAAAASAAALTNAPASATSTTATTQASVQNLTRAPTTSESDEETPMSSALATAMASSRVTVERGGAAAAAFRYDEDEEEFGGPSEFFSSSSSSSSTPWPSSSSSSASAHHVPPPLAPSQAATTELDHLSVTDLKRLLLQYMDRDAEKSTAKSERDSKAEVDEKKPPRSDRAPDKAGDVKKNSPSRRALLRPIDVDGDDGDDEKKPARPDRVSDKAGDTKKIPSSRSVPRRPVDVDGDDSEDEQKAREEEERDAAVHEEIEVSDEEEDDSAYKSWVTFFETREHRYPLARNQSMYHRRYSLLNEFGRRCEYLRTMFMTNADARLFSRAAKRWYATIRSQWEASSAAARPIRASTVTSTPMPSMTYVKGAARLRAKSMMDDDINAYSDHLGNIPEDLKGPVPEAMMPGFRAPTTLDEVVAILVGHRKLAAITMLRDASRHKPRVKVEQEFLQPPPRVPADPRQAFRDRAFQTKYGDDDFPKLERDDDPEVITRMFHDTNKTLERMKSRGQAEQAAAHEATADLRRQLAPLKSEMDGRSDGDSTYRSARVLSDRSYSSDPYAPSIVSGSSVMEAVASQLTAQARSMIEMTRSTRDIQVKEMRAIERRTAESIPKFDGNLDRAPSYFLTLCQKMCTYPFSVDECMRIMTDTMEEGPKSWFAAMLSEVTTVFRSTTEGRSMSAGARMATILGKFKAQYLGPERGLFYKTQLLDVKFPLPLSTQAVTSHYHAFQQLHLASYVCGSPPSDPETVAAYVKNLPLSVRTVIGLRSSEFTLFDQAYQAALKAVPILRPDTNMTSRDPFEVVELHAMDAKTYRSRDDIERRGYICFHCGVRGHKLDGCPVLQNNEAPTMAGRAAWHRAARDYDTLGDNYEEYMKPKVAEVRLARRSLREHGNAEAASPRRSTGARLTPSARERLRDKPRDARSSKPAPPGSSRIRREGDRERGDRSRPAPPAADRDKPPVGASRQEPIPVNQLQVSTSSSRYYSSDEDDDDEEDYHYDSDDRDRDYDDDDDGDRSAAAYAMSVVDARDDTDDAETKLTYVAFTATREAPPTELALARAEAHTAKSMSVQTEINGVPCGWSLYDPGATRTLIRERASKKLGPLLLTPLVGYEVVVGNGARVPVTHRFVAALHLNGVPFNPYTLVYVVKDMGSGGDIPSDVVVGRTTMAYSTHPSIETRTAVLYHRDNPAAGEIQCEAAESYVDEAGKSQVRPRKIAGGSTVLHQVEILECAPTPSPTTAPVRTEVSEENLIRESDDAEWEIEVEPPRRRQQRAIAEALRAQEKKEEREKYRTRLRARKEQQTRRDANKLELIKRIVAERKHLSDEAKEVLVNYIYTQHE